MARTFPKGSRIDSSNYDPFKCFNVGCQLVALNYQTFDKYFRANYAKFIDNGQCGYILKPGFFFSDKPVDTSTITRPLADNSNQISSLSVRIISARFLPKPPHFADTGIESKKKKKGFVGSIKSVANVNTIKSATIDKLDTSDHGISDPVLSVMVYGVERDTCRRQTSKISDNGLKPTWNDTLSFNFVMSSTAVMLFTVHSQGVSSKPKLAHYGLPVETIRSGYRIVPLFDSKNFFRPIPLGTIFCHFTIKK